MNRIAIRLAVSLGCLLSITFVAFASPFDGMTLTVSRTPVPESLNLVWTGGQPTFRVYRSANRQGVTDPANLIGTADIRTFDDTPPPGAIFYYEIASPCVYNPPEVCNGLDDDCDGTIDGPGSEVSCSLPHATPTCSQGACAVGACATGWGDCDGGAADGCEAPLGVAQSTSPSSIWQNDPNPNKDLKVGYARVSAIINCGACGVSCDDGIACTTDLCVPVGSTGVCRHYNRGQCSEARCGGLSLPPGTPPPGDPGCTAPDSDGDGLSDMWESAQTDPYTGATSPIGIDLNCNGEISDSDQDYVYSDPPMGPSVKDVYVKIAYMAPSTLPGQQETESHAPLPGVVDACTAAFAGQGIKLHVDPAMLEVPHAGVVYFPTFPSNPCATGDAVSFYDIKSAVFDPRSRFTHRFVLFAHSSCCAGCTESESSGLAEVKGNDAIVSLGAFDYAGTGAQVTDKKTMEQAGTLLHELGHTLGLDHGGPVGPNEPCYPTPCGSAALPQKPNYLSVMNYRYQFGILRAATPGTLVPHDPVNPRRVDFSTTNLADLVESSLNELAGITGATPPYDRDVVSYACLGQPNWAPGQGPIDWNCDNVYSGTVAADIDDDAVFSTLPGASDWGNLDYRFQCNPTFVDGADNPRYATPHELSLAWANAHGLRARTLCQSNADCDDGLFCNGLETCASSSGLCQPGTPPSCDDLNPCTVDACSAASNACVHDPVPANGTPCGTAFCVVGQACSNGVCGGGTARNCDDGLACTTDGCSEALQACTVSCSSTPCWTTVVGSGTASAPASDTAFVPSGATSTSYVVKGSSLYAIRNTGDALGSAGSIRWTWTDPSAGTLQNFPAPVPLSSGGEFIFLGSQDGSLYKINAADGATSVSINTRRANCATDSLIATPAVQLYSFSNSQFKNEMDSHSGHSGDDVVFVITKDQCGDTTRNRVIAYYASNLALKWQFNGDATKKMDFGSDGCTVDTTNNRVYCGTNLPEGGTQNTLWALDSINATGAGPALWSSNAGSIQNRPTLANGRLYVVSKPGSIMAYDPAGSSTGGAVRLWTSPAAVPAAVSRNPWVEFRPGGFQGTILVVDDAGTLTRFTDSGDHATRNWSVTPGPGLAFTSMTAVDPIGGLAYLGRNDGRLQQINLTTGAAGASFPLSPPDNVFDPSIDLAVGPTGFNRLTVASGGATGAVTQFCAWPQPGACTSDADCTGLSDACVTGICDPIRHACRRAAALDGTACNDGRSCTSTDVCKSGVCQSDSYASCPCVSIGDAACPAGLTCCGSGGCKDLKTSSANCGSCGGVCPVDRLCSDGTCVAAPAACVAPTDTTLGAVASGLIGADALDFDHLDLAGSACSAYVTTYRYPSVSTLQRVDAAGTITTMTNPSPDSAPMNGVAVSREGNQVYATAVNRPLGSFPPTTPALLDGSFAPPHLGVSRTTSATFSGAPFATATLDQGPVGPAFDWQSFSASGGSSSALYYANWAANGDLVALQRPCPTCTWSQTPVPVAIAPPGDRITALAFEPRRNPATLYHPYLVVGHGTTLSIVDLDLSTQNDVDLAAAQPTLGVSAILGIVVHPVYGDYYVEVKGSTGSRYLLNIDAHDMSCRPERVVQDDLHLQPPIPMSFPNDGRLTLMPDFQLLRMVPAASGSLPPLFQKYTVSR